MHIHFKMIVSPKAFGYISQIQRVYSRQAELYKKWSLHK